MSDDLKKSHIPGLPAYTTVSAGVLGWGVSALFNIIEKEDAQKDWSTIILCVSMLVFVIGVLWCLRNAFCNMKVDSNRELGKHIKDIGKVTNFHEHH